jgi:signal transduction histidine kinase/CHASE3 domain sensor protein/CheY-like chemotaxis protein
VIFSKQKKILAGFVLAFSTLIFGTLLLLGSATQQRKTAAWVSHTRGVLEKMNELVMDLSEAENGRRGYVLSQNTRYWGSFTNGAGRATAALRGLRELTKDNPRRARDCDRLEGMIHQRLMISTNSIKARQERGLDELAQMAFMEQGQEAMDLVRQFAAHMTAEETALLEKRQAQHDKNAKGTEGLAVLVALFGLSSFAILFVLLARANRRRHRAEEDLRQTNLELEQRVQQRTAELARTAEKAAWLASFPENNPNPIIELDLEKGVIHYANPFTTRLFPDLQSRALQHPLFTELAKAAKPLLTNGTGVVRREIAVGDFHYAQTISRVPGGQRLRIYSNDITERKIAEEKAHAQLSRLELLHRITRAIGERQDLKSIFHVVIRTLEDNLPIDFGCICLYEPEAGALTVASVGGKSDPLAIGLALAEQARIPIDQNGLSQSVQGKLVYEPDIAQVPTPFPQRLVRGGLRSLVVAPLAVESQVFGVLVAARREAQGFTSTDCEFLRQLSEHVALAAHSAQVYDALQQAYHDLHETQQTVMQQERLRALGQMASGVAHDINNAISPIVLYTESLLEREPNLTPRGREYLETIQRSIEDVTHTVTRMREFYRQREPQLALAPVDLNRMAQQVLELTRARWSDMPQQRGITIDARTVLAADLPAIMGVESEIREALTNLVFNAIDAMPEGGKLTLRTKIPESASASTPRHVHVEISDSGTGMDEETKRRCLEPFFTTKGERGTGLGLAMVYGIVQRHRAEVEIESAAGEGTTMRLIFSVPEEIPAGPVQARTEFATPSRLRILIIDDDPLVLKSVQHALEADGHIVTAANQGQEGIDAFAAAQNGHEPFAVVITDLGMPYVDGRKVATAVKAASPATSVILLTGWGQRLVADGEVPPHVDHVLSKPPKLRELREALARCCQP